MENLNDLETKTGYRDFKKLIVDIFCRELVTIRTELNDLLSDIVDSETIDNVNHILDSRIYTN